METYKLKVKHDTGTIHITTTGTSPENAAQKVMQSEGCPRAAIIEIHRDNIGVMIAQKLTAIIMIKTGITYGEASKIVYDEFNTMADECQLGDWISLPDGTTYTCTYKPKAMK